MGFSSLFISRPVLAIVVNLAVFLLGAVSFRALGIRDYPDVDPPVVTVSTTYGGAGAEVMETQITEPLEESVNGIAGIRTLTSSSADGRSTITVEFNLGTDLEAAANDVRDRVSRAMRQLPPDADNPVVSKADANAVPVLMVAVQSASRSPLDLTDIANNQLKERLQTIPGVSEARIWGEKKYAMRLRLDPVRMAALAVTPQDIKAALDRENVELPAGRIEGTRTELSIRSVSRLREPEDFNRLILRETGGRAVRLQDIGFAEAGPENERSLMRRNGVPMLGLVLVPQPGANHIAIADEFYRRLADIKRSLPADVVLDIGFDVTITIRKSVEEVLLTVLLAFFLVVLVIFAFFRNWRATIIPVLAMPISLTGAFFIMSAAGFSINILTLLAVVLATGLVVDDAIVVLENIYAKIERGDPPLDAGHQGSREIFFAILATTLALVAVMMPVIFLQGLSGRLFREFGTVLAGSVAISSFVSLTLTPMLCTRFLRHHAPEDHSLYARTEPFFERFILGYRNALTAFMGRRGIAFYIMAVAGALIVLFFKALPTEMAPIEDRSRINVNVTGPEGASFEYMISYMEDLDSAITASVPELDALISMTPSGGGGALNNGYARMTLTLPGSRKRSQQRIAEKLTKDLSRLAGAKVIVVQEQTIGDRRSGLPVQLAVQAPNLEILRQKVPAFLQAMAQDPVFQVADVNLKFTKPELRLSVDPDAVSGLGLSSSDVAQTLQLALSGGRYGYFIRNGKQYPVIGQFSRQDRSRPDDLRGIALRNPAGALVPLENLIRLEEVSVPPQLYRFNRNSAATVSAGLAPGRTLGEGIAAARAIARETLGDSVTTALSGPARDFAESSSSLLFAFFAALVLIYLILAAQFESFRHPLTVMLTVPLALAGALMTLWYFNQSLNIFSQIGIIMLIGLVTKNGILIVEFTNQRRKAGMPLERAVIEGAVSRFRPILMTSLTVVLGTLPIALAMGSGAESRMSLGIAVIGGLVFSLVLSLFVVPAVYSTMAAPDQPTSSRPRA